MSDRLSLALRSVPTAYTFTMYGNQTPDGLPQATLTAGTVCANCRKHFQAGDDCIVSLAMPPAQGTIRHRDCANPTGDETP